MKLTTIAPCCGTQTAELTCCSRCGGQMKPGIALEQTYTGSPDFPGGEVVTMSPGGPGRLVRCMKCERCGWSVR